MAPGTGAIFSALPRHFRASERTYCLFGWLAFVPSILLCHKRTGGKGRGGDIRRTQAPHGRVITVKCPFKAEENQCLMSSLRLLLRAANPAFFNLSAPLVNRSSFPFYKVPSNSLDSPGFHFCALKAFGKNEALTHTAARSEAEARITLFPQSQLCSELSQRVHYCPEAFISVITQGPFKTV